LEVVHVINEVIKTEDLNEIQTDNLLLIAGNAINSRSNFANGHIGLIPGKTGEAIKFDEFVLRRSR
jgi:hypothetical protein